MITTDKSHLTVAALSHPGEEREINEDRYSVTYYKRESDQMTVTLAIVADGIGGHQAGEVAAQLAVDEVSGAMADASGDDPVAELSEAIIGASRSISESSMQDEALQGMGSTIATAMTRTLFFTAYLIASYWPIACLTCRVKFSACIYPTTS